MEQEGSDVGELEEQTQIDQGVGPRDHVPVSPPTRTGALIESCHCNRGFILYVIVFKVAVKGWACE